MKQIKTVQYKIDAFDEFDKTVNGLLAEGWTLVQRLRTALVKGKLYTSHPMYVAYLEREV